MIQHVLLNLFNVNQVGCFRVVGLGYLVKGQFFFGKKIGVILMVIPILKKSFL